MAVVACPPSEDGRVDGWTQGDGRPLVARLRLASLAGPAYTVAGICRDAGPQDRGEGAGGGEICEVVQLGRIQSSWTGQEAHEQRGRGRLGLGLEVRRQCVKELLVGHV
jgi:hypothetical protein